MSASDWATFLAAERKAGRTPKEAGAKWRALKTKPKAAHSAPALTHVLETAPINSKVVGTEVGTAFATPERVILLAKDDLAGKLPAGARIQKVAEHQFVATQLDAAVFHADQTYPSAVAAIQDFLPHFHPRGG